MVRRGETITDWVLPRPHMCLYHERWLVVEDEVERMTPFEASIYRLSHEHDYSIQIANHPMDRDNVEDGVIHEVFLKRLGVL